MRNFKVVNLDRIMAEINYDISLLYVIPCVYTRNIVLNHLRDRIALLESVTKTMEQAVKLQAQTVPPQTVVAQAPSAPIQPVGPDNQTVFTLEELSRFDGKNGNSAYAAVNGTVYDVTNNAAWAAATHFGLTAGRDLTGEFASCHAGQPILNKLRKVGKLV